MGLKTIYKSKKCEAEMMDVYDRQLSRLGIEYEERMIKTRFGDTHVLITGPKNAPPLITLHGGNGNSPLNLSLFLPLTKCFRVYAPDTVGFPGKSEQTRLSPNDNSYGQWVVDVMDGLSLESVAFVTSSYSSGILLQTASFAPERISQAILHVPSGIAHGPIMPMMKIIVQWLTYPVFPKRDRLIKAFQSMVTETNEDFLEFCDAMLRDYRIELRGPKEFTKEELKNFKAPTFVIAAKDDIFFPANKVIPKAKYVIQNLTKIECIDGGHLSSKETLEHVNNEIIEFINGHILLNSGN